nr:MAG TPA: hypothetical protein [Caudoviricetes sp.]
MSYSRGWHKQHKGISKLWIRLIKLLGVLIPLVVR